MLAHASCVAIWSAANRRRARCVAPLGGVATSKGVFSRNADRVHSRAPRRARRADESEGHQAIRAETHGAGAHHRRPALPGPTRRHVATPDLFEPRRDEPQRRDARRRAPRPRLHGGPGSSRLRRHLPGHHRAGRGARGADQHGGFHTLNLCLDNAIAEAVTEYTRLRDEAMAAGQTERSGIFAHELRNRLASALLGFQAIKSGRAPTGGSVAAVVTRSLHGMTELISRALVEVRLDSGTTSASASTFTSSSPTPRSTEPLEAGVHGVSLHVAPMDRRSTSTPILRSLLESSQTSYRTPSSSRTRGDTSRCGRPWSGRASRSR